MYDTDKAILIEYFCHPRLRTKNGGIGNWQTKNKLPNQRFAVKSPTPSKVHFTQLIQFLTPEKNNGFSMTIVLESECTMLSSVPMIFSPGEIRAGLFCCFWNLLQLHFLHILTIFLQYPCLNSNKNDTIQPLGDLTKTPSVRARWAGVFGAAGAAAQGKLHHLLVLPYTAWEPRRAIACLDPTPGGWSWEIKCWWTSIDEHCISHKTGPSSLGVITGFFWSNGQRNGGTIESWG